MGFFEKLRQGLSKTKNAIFGRIKDLFISMRKVDEDMLDELEEILITADVGVETTEKIIAALRRKIQEDRLTESEDVYKALKEIISSMIDDGEPLDLSSKPSVVLVIGVNGVGKTTSIAKIASYLKGEGKKVILAAADTFRAAAADQLGIWADRIGVDMIRHDEGSDPASVVFDAIAASKARGADVLIIDTAGRLHNKKNLMDELSKIDRVINRELPGAARETLLVLDATTGQNAVIQAKEFSNTAKITGLILTKLDGTAKGGIVISVKDELGIPVKFIGVGEKKDDMQPFVAADFIEALFE
jgi:fused signal recognition particle receptor